jgi:phosphoribosylanthranilate isomerase
MIFAPSPRRISSQAAGDIAQKLPSTTMAVSVFVDPDATEIARAHQWFPAGLLQFSGSEPASLVERAGGDRAIKALRVGPGDRSDDIDAACRFFAKQMILFDTKSDALAGGTGKTFPWDVVAPIARRRRVIVAGGLRPDNVADCVRAIRPYGVDVRSGVETDGRKDAEKMRAFVRAVRSADDDEA